MTPSFTIAIPVFERIFGFEEALQSAIDVKGCSEILVVDDGSSHTEFMQICAARNDPRIKYFKNEVNLGLFGNWNQCACLAKSDFVSILCSDDVIDPNIFTWFQDAYNQMPDLDIFFGSFAVFKNSLEEARELCSYPAGPYSSQKLLEDAAERGAWFPVLSVIRREKLLQFPFVAKPHSGNDFLWIFSNASNFKLFAHSRPLSFWRRHANQDAKISQSTTTDCWPMQYAAIEIQLKKMGSKKAGKAYKRAVGVILSWLLNDKNNKGHWHQRLLGSEAADNPFLYKAKSIIDQNWLLSGLINARIMRPFYYNIGRVCRKLKIYPAA